MVTQRTFTVISQNFPGTEKGEQCLVVGIDDFAIEELIIFHKFLGNYIYKHSNNRSILLNQVNNADNTKERNVH